MPPAPSPELSHDPEGDASRKLAVLHAVLKGHLSVDEACRHYAIDPATYHDWADRYWQDGKSALIGDDDAIDFILQLGMAVHSYGATAHRLEDALTLVARRFGLEGRFFSTPTAIMAGFGPISAERTSLVRVVPGEIDLEKLSELNDVTWSVANGTLKLTEARAQLKRIVGRKPRYSITLVSLAYGLASMSTAVIFGGGVPEIVVAGGIGLVVGLLVQMGQRRIETARLMEPSAAAVAALISAWAAQAIGPVSVYVTTFAGIIALLPGLTLTRAMIELATQNLASGSARFAGAFVQLTGLGFGVALGTVLGFRLWPDPAPIPLPEAWPTTILTAAVLAAGLGFTVLFQVRPREAGWVIASGALAFAGARLGASWLGPEIGALVGAFVLTMASNAYASWLHRSATVISVPGIILLVPGSVGIQGFVSLLEHDAMSGVAAAFRMILIAMSLVAGILLANVALPTRRPL